MDIWFHCWFCRTQMRPLHVQDVYFCFPLVLFGSVPIASRRNNDRWHKTLAFAGCAPFRGREFCASYVISPIQLLFIQKNTICKQTMVSAAEGASHTAVRNAIVVFSLGCECPSVFHIAFVSLFSFHILDSILSLRLSLFFLVRLLPALWFPHTYR